MNTQRNRILHTLAVVSLSLGTLAMSDAGHADVSGGDELPLAVNTDISGTGSGSENMLAVRNECIDCSYVGYDPSPPEAGYHWVYYIGAAQCEDGYSENGPCPPCEGQVCTEGYIWSDIEEELCELEECIPSEEHAQLVHAVRLGTIEDVRRSLAVHRKAARLDEARAVIELLSCLGTVVRTVPLSYQAVWQITAARQGRRITDAPERRSGR